MLEIETSDYLRYLTGNENIYISVLQSLLCQSSWSSSFWNKKKMKNACGNWTDRERTKEKLLGVCGTV